MSEPRFHHDDPHVCYWQNFHQLFVDVVDDLLQGFQFPGIQREAIEANVAAETMLPIFCIPIGAILTEETHFFTTTLKYIGSVHNKLADGGGDKFDKEIQGWRVDFNLHSLLAYPKPRPEGRHQVRRRHTVSMRVWLRN
jgi:hypothetical protein